MSKNLKNTIDKKFRSDRQETTITQLEEKDKTDYELAIIGAFFDGHRYSGKGSNGDTLECYIVSEDNHFSNKLPLVFKNKEKHFRAKKLNEISSIPENSIILLDTNILIYYKKHENRAKIEKIFDYARTKRISVWMIDRIANELLG